MIDAHFHCWKLSRGDYGWLTPELPVLYRDVSVSDWASHAKGWAIDGGLLVQAAPTEAETHFLLDQARQHPMVLGVIGWVDMLAQDAVQRIERLAVDPLLKGLRPMLQDLDDERWILQPALKGALQTMSDLGLVFDALIKPVHLPHILKLMQQFPQLRVVIDHGAKPSPSGSFNTWQMGMMALAELRHHSVCCKMSGLWTEWPAGSECNDLIPWCEALLSMWGAERLMWGSDWPVLEMAGDYANWRNWSVEFLQQRCSADEQALILDGNARSFYRL